MNNNFLHFYENIFIFDTNELTFHKIKIIFYEKYDIYSVHLFLHFINNVFVIVK